MIINAVVIWDETRPWTAFKRDFTGQAGARTWNTMSAPVPIAKKSRQRTRIRRRQ